MITDVQREERRKGVGASDVPAILEVCPFRTPWEVWAEKVGKIPPFEGNMATWIGTVLEPALRTAASELIGQKVVACTSTMIARNGIMRSNLDGMVGKSKKGSPVVEIKVTSMAERWGKGDTDEIPDNVLAQVTAQMVCAESYEAHVVALINDWALEIRHYHVTRDADVAEMIETECVRFWREHVETGIAPPITRAGRNTNELLGQIERQAGSETDIPGELIEAYLSAGEAEKAADAAKQLARAQILAALGDHSVGTSPLGVVKVAQVKQQRLDGTALKKAHPELAAAFTRQTGFARLTVKRNEGGTADAQDE